MSQIHSPTTVNPPPPPNPTMFVLDDGTAVPLANVLNVNGEESSENVTNGIITRANPNGSKNLEIILTNRIQRQVSTINDTPTDLSTFDCGVTPGIYNFDIQIAGYDVTDTAGCGYFISGSIRTDGANATLVGTPDKIVNEEASTVTCDANLIVNANNAIIRVTGIAGKNIHWRSLSQYIFVS